MISLSLEAIRVLRTEAARCRRVAKGIFDFTLLQTLEQVAAELEGQAERLESLPDLATADRDTNGHALPT